ncbi:UNVERIFIED_CONTAM: hypothetical protein RMT77_011086 [Armadillidium vulgare]
MNTVSFLILCLNTISIGLCEQIWTKVYVENSKVTIDNELVFKEIDERTAYLKMYIPLKCASIYWCQIACLNSGNKHVFSNIEVSPFYTNISEALLCYTKVRPNIMNKIIQIFDSSSANTGYSTKIPEQFLKGINLRDNNKCLILSSSGNRMWFLIELDKEYEIEEVLLTPQTYSTSFTPNNVENNKFRNLEIKIGKTKEFGDFSSYELLGTYEGPNIHDAIVSIQRKKPVKGRFISIEKIYKTGNENFFVCFIQIFPKKN